MTTEIKTGKEKKGSREHCLPACHPDPPNGTKQSSSTAREPCLKGSWTVHLRFGFSRPGEHWAWLAAGAKHRGCPPRSPDGGEFTAALPHTGLRFLSVKTQETGQAVSEFELPRVKPQLECSNGKITTFFFFFNNLRPFIMKKIFNFTGVSFSGLLLCQKRDFHFQISSFPTDDPCELYCVSSKHLFLLKKHCESIRRA